MTDRNHDEPAIVYTVRELFAELRAEVSKRFDDLSRQLDEKVSVGAFRALASELDATQRRMGDMEDEVDDLKDWKTAVDSADTERRRVSDRTIAWLGLVVAALTALATLGYLVAVIFHL